MGARSEGTKFDQVSLFFSIIRAKMRGWVVVLVTSICSSMALMIFSSASEKELVEIPSSQLETWRSD